MSQVYLAPENLHGDRFLITGKEAHHVISVLRKKVGDEIVLFDGKKHRFRGQLSSIGLTPPSLSGKIIGPIETPIKSFQVRLFQGLPRGSKFDYVIEKATELGVDELIPFISEKSLIKLDSKSSHSKTERWKRLIEAASKQSDRDSLPLIYAPKNIFDLKDEFSNGATIVFSLSENSHSIREIMKNQFQKMPRIINLIVGPESGFSEGEIKWFSALGVLFASLGNLTLRTETAGLVALSLVNYEFGVL